jgi:hypothetical protein
MTSRTFNGWALLWRSDSALSGRHEYLMCSRNTGVFKTRGAARAYAKKKYGYIAERPDLQQEPHGWKMPRVVKVRMTVETVE